MIEEERERLAHENAIKQLELHRLEARAQQEADRDKYIKEHGIESYYGDKYNSRPVASEGINELRQKIVQAKLKGMTRDQARAVVEKSSPEQHKEAFFKIVDDVYSW